MKIGKIVVIGGSGETYVKLEDAVLPQKPPAVHSASARTRLCRYTCRS